METKRIMRKDTTSLSKCDKITCIGLLSVWWMSARKVIIEATSYKDTNKKIIRNYSRADILKFLMISKTNKEHHF